MYQFADLIFRYDHVEIRSAVYDPEPDVAGLRVDIYVRPILRFGFKGLIKLFVFLELEDFHVDVQEGDNMKRKTLKKIKIQRDYFFRDPITCMLPIIGDIYLSDTLRFFLGRTQATIIRMVRMLAGQILPSDVGAGFFGYGYKAEQELQSFLKQASEDIVGKK